MPIKSYNGQLWLKFLLLKCILLQPKEIRSRRGETSSLNGQTALEKLKRRRESLGLRKRSRSRDTGMLMYESK